MAPAAVALGAPGDRDNQSRRPARAGVDTRGDPCHLFHSVYATSGCTALRRVHPPAALLQPQPALRLVHPPVLRPSPGVPVLPPPVWTLGYHHPGPDEGPGAVHGHPAHLPGGVHAAPCGCLPTGLPTTRQQHRPGHPNTRRHLHHPLLLPLWLGGAGHPPAHHQTSGVHINPDQGGLWHLPDRDTHCSYQPTHRYDVRHLPEDPGAVRQGVEVWPSSADQENEPDFCHALPSQPICQTLLVHQGRLQTQRYTGYTFQNSSSGDLCILDSRTYVMRYHVTHIKLEIIEAQKARKTLGKLNWAIQLSSFLSFFTFIFLTMK